MDIDDEIENYFPAIVDEDLFKHVRGYIYKKSAYNGVGKFGGPNGKCINILKGMVICSCGATMSSSQGKERKGKERKGKERKGK